jgi:hypothetical protein
MTAVPIPVNSGTGARPAAPATRTAGVGAAVPSWQRARCASTCARRNCW